MKKQTKSSPLKMAPIYGGPISNVNLDDAGANVSLGSAAANITNAVFSSGVNGWVQPVRGQTFCNDDNGGGDDGGANAGGGRGDCIDVEFVETCRPVYVLEKHMSVIRKGPTAPPKIEMYKWEDESDTYVDGVTSTDGLINVRTEFTGDAMPTATASDGTDISIFYNANKEILVPGDVVVLPIDLATGGIYGDPLDWEDGFTLIISYTFFNQFNVQQNASARVVITDDFSVANQISCIVLAVSNNFPLLGNTAVDIYEVKAEQVPPLFELKFPKFAYRYKYEDGEYSVFSPWSETAFMPGKFDYLPKKGYNLGMVNNMRTLKVKDWRPKSMPEDVVEVDLLYKESNSSSIYTVETFKKNDPATQDNPCINNYFPPKVNHWNKCGTGDNFGNYTITSELIHKVVPSNQLLRPWDNVPRKALGQEVTANRMIYANYLQGYNVLDKDLEVIKPKFGVWVDTEDMSLLGGALGGTFYQAPGEPMKSLKSMRTYQIGVVYRDRYGRETPVLTSESGTVDLPIENAKTQNRLNVQINSPAPDWAESYTFYVKETANEYYNLAMDRWYDAEDDGIWLSFPSSERNKISDRTTLILKKQHNTHRNVESKSKYKVISIKNDAPTFIKTEHKYWGSLPMMLPPPGWGSGGKPGGWDTGMFHVTGLPLPNRLYIDVYAEYWDQSVLAGIEGEGFGSQIRVTQSENPVAAYNATPSPVSNKSTWYDIARVSRIGSEAQTYTEIVTDPTGVTVETEEEIPGQAEQIVRITLEEVMGEDMAFCEPLDNLSLSRGLALEVRTKVVRDRAQFEGRFFVKVLRDPDIHTNIVQTGQIKSDFFQVLMSRDVRYISAAHPGAQEARTGVAGTVGAGGGTWYGLEGGNRNFIPVSKTDPDSWDRKYNVSSLSAVCGNVAYEGPLGGMISPNEDVNGNLVEWPHGPGPLGNREFMSGWWYNAYYDNIDQAIATSFNNHYSNPATAFGTTGYPTWAGGSVFQDSPAYGNGWPSFAISDWEPRTCHPDSGAINPSCGNLTADWFVTGDYNGGIDLSNFVNVDPNKGMNDLNGVNAYMVPAIWGNQDDILGYTGNPDLLPTDLGLTGVNTVPLTQTFEGVWDAGTIDKLRKEWYYLYHGRDKVSKEWPLGRFSPMRWFIDKVGAAQGYSGNGIWTDENGVSRMSLSFYGIGSMNKRHRSHDMLTYQYDEYEFIRLMATTGTQFRFKSDPNQVVYTITNASPPETVYNYETSYGSWGYDDGNGAPTGGGNLGGQKFPPYGGTVPSTNNIAGKNAFISDLFENGMDREKTGGAMYNYRLRVTITLDKEIGSENILGQTANMGFHPLLNHVDADGNCNIKEGPQIYWDGQSGTTPSGWVGGSVLDGCQDVLPTTDKFYNLSSYWNKTGTAPTSGQSDQDTVGNINGQHFGLHERGLNSTAIEIVTPYEGDETRKKMSDNPAVWETEPMEDVGLDIYYAASPTYPIDTRRFRTDENRPDDTDLDLSGAETHAHLFDYNFRGEEIIPVGTRISVTAGPNGPADCNGTGVPCNYTGGWAMVVGIQENTIWMDTHLVEDTNGIAQPLAEGDSIKFVWEGEGVWYGAQWDNNLYFSTIESASDINIFNIDPNTHDKMRTLPYYNCYTFSNGVESNRIRDDYNAVMIDKGVKASMPLAETYEEERKPSGLIFSGIYNSTSGINRTNQFIQAEPITKDLNPINGSIQKLFARDTDLVTFCENKVFKILAKKDALFNADGNTNVTSNAAVLGQSIPFSGEYGISRNPESFAQESYRLYFSDKDRGSILRLSRDGLTPISDSGMKDWFRDNLRFASSIIGSFDQRKDEYNITLETADPNDSGNEKAYTLSFTEKSRGWVSFKSFVHQGGISHKNIYYTFPSNIYSNTTTSDPWGIPYSSGNGSAETYQHSLDLRVKRFVAIASSNSNEIDYSPDSNTIVLVGMNVEGDGIQQGSVVTKILNTQNGTMKCRISKNAYLDLNAEITFTTPRNAFYGNNHYSMVKTVFNRDQGSVKRFKTLNYEGSQAKIVPLINDGNGVPIPGNVGAIPGNQFQIEGIPVGQIYLDNIAKDGWYVHEITTDMQKGSVREFVDKENKWFDYIRGEHGDLIGDNLDTADFSLQGIGMFNGGNANNPTNQQ